ncbi:30S ribosomal protein S4 [Mesomycoplasma hyopneumoniae]|uniref:Small ribosomal subunit protein uS4 n=7 Tax=Mesomycoplasma hyopneumoniae TaxID=2099 RepID=RS4_MESH2|nr:30S ribosomal protein S4 [Mesomycoplasma hyopneumoniae]Q4A7F0.1 RecName: Full=Small ribosomal subunit protein uS4; AltName: Full=30S ribosomal protein S4 [Mesomycoplasma hyopneumoniae 7448]Q4A9B0.1 RecName: Full=Small ribosomal subunit protein uS4; AltName: Full=30S ribosomal protein S4 [Mesomycoplasma hyopneumoniae J]Q5ZZW4.1 RecName: Full=Small ribosomal subunit protein uS4; AltName: Full=30S ribosomal protein S4 [Mesomycoplasma hyopneumoniae 232]AAV27627.1 30s ribosomal protein S4 [Mesomy
MSRYTGSIFRKSRRLGFSILETGKEFAKGKQRRYAPGLHGLRRSKPSDYGVHLREKQKVRFMYGLSEKQFRNTYRKATKKTGIAGTLFLQALESRLDNSVYRAGFAETRRQARQLVNHGHFLVNNKKVDIPSFQLKQGDIFELTTRKDGKIRKNQQILTSLETRTPAAWLEVDKDNFKVVFNRMPERSELNQEIKESLIVEFYSK